MVKDKPALDQIIEAAEQGEPFTFARDGQPVAILIGYAEYERLMAREMIDSLRRIVRALHPDGAPDPLTARLIRDEIGEHNFKMFCQVVGGSNGTS